jgi:hypothetical protein
LREQVAPNPVIAGNDPQSIVVLHKGGYGSRVLALNDGRGQRHRENAGRGAASESQSQGFVFRGRIYPKLAMTQA